MCIRDRCWVCLESCDSGSSDDDDDDDGGSTATPTPTSTPTPTPCTAGYYCSGSNSVSYRYSDCSTVYVGHCPNGCNPSPLNCTPIIPA